MLPKVNMWAMQALFFDAILPTTEEAIWQAMLASMELHGPAKWVDYEPRTNGGVRWIDFI